MKTPLYTEISLILLCSPILYKANLHQNLDSYLEYTNVIPIYADAENQYILYLNISPNINVTGMCAVILVSSVTLVVTQGTGMIPLTP